MIHFDDVLSTAKEVVASDPTYSDIEEVLVLRDLRGRIRLFLKPNENKRNEARALCDRVATRLGEHLSPFWGNVVALDTPNGEFADILKPVRDERRPIEPENEFGNWWIIERHVAKSGWTTASHRRPWPLNNHTPPILSFYSHKGGVGRTTTLCAVAMNLARQAKKVVVVDLDLEAPALGTLLAETPVEYGVTDYLLERLLAGNEYRPDLRDFMVRQSDSDLIGDGGEPIRCFPAGKINEHYLQKLSRLDYELIAGYADKSNSPLAGLFSHIKSEIQPDYLLIDCRAGLHDLGGLAVHQLSHANVIFGLDSEQSWQGLHCILRGLGLIDPPPPCLLVQAMEWPRPDARRKESRERFLEAAYGVFGDTYYREEEVPPYIDSEDDPHYPCHLPYNQSLTGFQTLQDVAELLTKDPYPAFAGRVQELVQKAINNG
jgi:hypothetical protein